MSGVQIRSSAFPTPPSQDPEVMAAFVDVQSNPANAAKYKDNTKVQKVMEKLSATLASSGMGAGGTGTGPFNASGMGAAGGGDPFGAGESEPKDEAKFTSGQPPPEPAQEPMGAGMDLD